MAPDLYLPNNGETTGEGSILSLSSTAMVGCPLPYLPTLGIEQLTRSYSYDSLYANSMNCLPGLQSEYETWGKVQRYHRLEAMDAEAAVMLGYDEIEVLKEVSDDRVKLVHQLSPVPRLWPFNTNYRPLHYSPSFVLTRSSLELSFQRVASCFVQGLSDRVALIQALGVGGCTGKTLADTAIATPEKEEALRLFYETCPQIQFGHFVANASILEAFEGESSVPMMDLGMNIGSPWVQQRRSLMHSLANRAGQPPSNLQMTALGTASDCLNDTISELELYAKSLGMNFQFTMVEKPLQNLQSEGVNLLEDEALVVNSILQLHCVVEESPEALNSILQKICELSPKAVVVVEQDASHNGPFFLGRFMEALHYCSAIFDSVDAMLPKYDTRRAKVEQFYFAGETKNISSCEGSARVERHQRLDQWHRSMSRAGFQSAPMKMITEAKQWQEKVTPCEGYTVVEHTGCLLLGWKSKPCWKCS